jgi:hypothetical protein
VAAISELKNVQKSENVRVLTLKEIISFEALVQNTEKEV